MQENTYGAKLIFGEDGTSVKIVYSDRTESKVFDTKDQVNEESIKNLKDGKISHDEKKEIFKQTFFARNLKTR